MYRNNELLVCYLLRNPFYEKIIKKILERILSRFDGKF
jgi:hypothetical protein